MDILYALEKIRTPFWNGVMSAVTQLGGEVIFIVAAVVVFWCVSKWEGYYLMTIAFCGTVLNQFLKLICRVPRPWVRDPNFTIVESARAEATGYSFPSGHTQNAIGLFGGMARWGGRHWRWSSPFPGCIWGYIPRRTWGCRWYWRRRWCWDCIP